MNLGRRGLAETIPWFARAMMLLIAVIIIAMLVRTYTNRDVQSQNLHKNTYLYRLYYSDLLMYSDPATRRVYPGIVDYSKLTDTILDQTFPKPSDRQDAIIASKVVLTPKSCNLAPKTIYNNQETFSHTGGSFGNSLGGSGGALTETYSFPVTVRQGTIDCAGQLDITVTRLGS